MKYYKLNNEVFAFDGSQDDYIKPEMVLMTNDEIDRHLNPEKYLSDEEKLLIYRQNMPDLSPIEFDLKLNNAGIYDAVQELIKDNFELKIAYTRVTFFSRLGPFTIQASEALGLTPEQVDEIWTS